MKKYWVIAIYKGEPTRLWTNDLKVIEMLQKGYSIVRTSTDQAPVISNGEILWKDLDEGEYL